MTSALRGTTSEPVMQNSRTRTATTMMSADQGARSSMALMKSVCWAAAPPTQNGWSAVIARIRSTASTACWPTGSSTSMRTLMSVMSSWPGSGAAVTWVTSSMARMSETSPAAPVVSVWATMLIVGVASAG